ncbi:MAG: chloride channel protein [Gaiellales bacterium]
MARLIVLAAVLGVLASLGATAFLGVTSAGTKLVYQTLPGALGMETAPGWWAALMLAVGALVLLAARRLPGATGAGPLSGFHFETPVREAPSLLIAALGTLVFGFALGPEAPLIVLGTLIAGLALRGGPDDARRAAMALGGLAAIGAVFGNPFVTAFMVLEFAAFGALPAMMLVPALVALGTGYLVQVGLWGLPGLGTHSLTVPGLAPYTSIGIGDLALGVVVALLAGAVALVARVLGERLDAITGRRAVLGAIIATAMTAAVAVVADGVFGVPLDLVLFSGQTGMEAVIAETSAGVVLVVVAAKVIAYGVALGGGMRGGPIFPATYLGVAVGVLVALVIPSGEATPLAAVGIAAAAAAMTRLPATSGLLAMLLISGTGAAIAPFAIIGAIVGLLLRLALDRRRGVDSAIA